ncbi:MAG: FTR1 family protein [Actinomycetota bacterium]|nr:FTR1 family protein [Actinomycetota bacterium]
MLPGEVVTGGICRPPPQPVPMVGSGETADRQGHPKGAELVVAAFFIFLREGIEASMVVAVLLAYLNRIGQRQYFRDVLTGVGAAMGLAALAGVVAYLTIRTYAGSRVQTVFETVTFVLATVLLTYMTFWMRSHARSIGRELQERSQQVIDGRARHGMALLAFQAVGREGIETVVFTLAIAFSTSAAVVLAGAAGGLVVSLGMAFAIYRLGHRINMALFFKVVGALLIFFAAGLLTDAVQNIQHLGWLPVLSAPLWDTSRLLPDGGTVGGLLHAFFGYASRPSGLDLGVWAVYLTVTGGMFLRSPAPGRPGGLTPSGRRTQSTVG